jgi:hypothetical protein
VLCGTCPGPAPGKTYGTFEYGVPVKARKTTVLPFTIWMPLLDTEHACLTTIAVYLL